MQWFEALQLAIRLVTAITSVIGQMHVSGHDLVDTTKMPSDVITQLRQFCDHCEGTLRE